MSHEARYEPWADWEGAVKPHPRIYVIRKTCSGSPVQWEGLLDDGRDWYFRARFEHASLGVGATPEEAVWAACWELDPSGRLLPGPPPPGAVGAAARLDEDEAMEMDDDEAVEWINGLLEEVLTP